jgi:hypothetical protein
MRGRFRQREEALLHCRTKFGALLAICAVMAGCTGGRSAHQGKLLLDRGTPRPLHTNWVTSKAIEGVDPETGPLADLIRPIGLAVGPGDSIYVADRDAHRIVVYDPAGHPVRIIGREGDGPGEFRELSAIVADGEGRLWVAESIRLQLLDLDGSCVATGGGMAGAHPGAAVGVTSDGVFWIGQSTILPGPVAFRLVRDGARLAVEPAELGFRLHTRGLVLPKPWCGDLLCSLAETRTGGFVALLPALTLRKSHAWLQEYDATGALVREFDVEGDIPDRGDALSDLRETSRKHTLSRLVGGADGHAYVCHMRKPTVICRVDLEEPRFLESYEVLLSGPGEEVSRLQYVSDFATDSQGRLDILAHDAEFQPILLQTERVYGARPSS